MSNDIVTIWQGPLPDTPLLVGKAIWSALHRLGDLKVKQENYALKVGDLCIVLEPYMWEK